MEQHRPTLAVWKFASCDGCQLSLLDCEDELLAIADRVAISYFPEATSTMVDGPYDVSLVEGSITTAHDVMVTGDRYGGTDAADRSRSTNSWSPASGHPLTAALHRARRARVISARHEISAVAPIS